MTTQQIVDKLIEKFGTQIEASFPSDKHPRVHVTVGAWVEVARFMHDDPELKFDWLSNLSGVDYLADEKLCVVYDLWSFNLNHSLAVKVFVPRDVPVVPSVSAVWKAADWHEREAFDLFGIVFAGHPDPRRILLADDWVGHPLRKDYEFPREYHGIPGSVELDWQHKPDYPD